MTPQEERIKELEAKLVGAEYEREAMASLWYEGKKSMQDKLTEAQAEIERLRGALEKVFYAASPGASRNEWVCFKAADEALAKYAEGKDDGGGV